MMAGLYSEQSEFETPTRFLGRVGVLLFASYGIGA